MHIGIDPSLRGTGVVAIDKYQRPHSKLISSDLPAKSLGQRFNLYAANVDMLRTFIDGFEDESIDCIVFEQSYESRMSNGVMLVENAAMLKRICMEFAPTYELAPMSLRKFIGDAKMKKEMMPVKIAQRWKVDLPSHDEYVAYALARVAMVASRCYKPETSAQEEVVEKMLAVKVPKKRKKRDAA